MAHVRTQRVNWPPFLNRVLPALFPGWGRLSLVALPALAALVLALILSSSLREWFLSSLGYGLVPVSLWLVALVLTFRYRRGWIWRYYGLWLASALGVMASIGILSFFSASDGVLEEASLGGYWGQTLAGRPMVWGALKVAIILLLVPMAIVPKRTLRWYRRGVLELLASGGTLLRLFNWPLRYGSQRIGRRSFDDGLKEEEYVATPSTLSQRLATKIPRFPRLRPIAGKDMKGAIPHSGVGVYDETPAQKVIKVSKWRLPGVDLLARSESQAVPQSTLNEMSQLIETTLSEHGVKVSVEDIKPGPRVIRFGLVPGWVKRYREIRDAKFQGSDSSPLEPSRVKVHSILAREQDLALALKTPDIRIEAPVPGEALVGLEVPNPLPNKVHMRSVAEGLSFRQVAGRGGLPLGLGQGTGGEPVVEDLIELPHLLIAGATGSGKSVCVNSIITSLLMTTPPDRLQMLMIDPKRVELTPFNDLPHLLAPVVVDSDEVLRVLAGVIREMFRRYRMLEEAGVRNIEGYNRKAKEPISYLVLIIDELADLMMSAAYEMEQALVRLAQLGRATGIHLVLCTQRPSVNVVTGLLKANVSARIAFAVASQVDSRVILDGAGAEKLLGKGDMLLLSSESPKPRRIQGTFVSDQEIDKVVQFWRRQKGPPLPEIPLDEPEGGDLHEADETEDELLDQALELASKYNHLSPSLLQRRLQIGYPRALRLMQLLEEEGVIGGGDPGKSRAVLKKG